MQCGHRLFKLKFHLRLQWKSGSMKRNGVLRYILNDGQKETAFFVTKVTAKIVTETIM